MIRLQKNTANDKRNILREGLRKFNSGDSYNYLRDYDDEFVYFEREVYTSGHESIDGWVSGFYEETLYRVSYTYSGTTVSFGAAAEEVVALTEYKVVDDKTTDATDVSITEPTVVGAQPATVKPMVAPAPVAINSTQAGAAVALEFTQKSLTTLVADIVKSALGKEKSLPVMKQFNDEKMVSYEPLYIAAGEVDGVGDTYLREDVDFMVKSFNEANTAGDIQPALFHKHATGAFTINKAFVNEFDVVTPDGTHIPEGQPIAEIQFVSKAAWQARKDGDLMGLSIGCNADFEEIS